VKFPFDIALPILPVKLTIGKEREPVAAPAPTPVGASYSTLMFDGKDAAIVCLGLALMLATLVVIILAARSGR